ncbi:cobalamin B12-binding domain-containing protein [Thermoanaerobacterium sp. DL9XJH110]|uniref:cobalamin B12-binding domain-containing protein n=1 Tax=Thermoanaerobacterium sp. DL9XJH110 TaxID=3386643 RepID=UPI003BB7DDB7
MIDWTRLTQAVGDLDEEQVLKILKDFVASHPGEEEGQKAIAACQEGMKIVGVRFESGEYFVGDLIFAGLLLTESIEILKPVIGRANSKKIGSIVLGTVQGDLHDIGKNIFRSMAEAAGFEVYDLGIDQPVNHFVEKVKQIKPNIVGMSGVLTLAIESMKNTIEGLKVAGLREGVKIIIGGNPVTREVCEYVGADAFTNNAAEGVKICQEWVK